MISEYRSLAAPTRKNRPAVGGEMACDSNEAIALIDDCLANALGEVGSFILQTTLDEIGVDETIAGHRELKHVLHDIEDSLRPIFGELNTLQLMRHIRGQLYA